MGKDGTKGVNLATETGSCDLPIADVPVGGDGLGTTAMGVDDTGSLLRDGAGEGGCR